MPKTIRAEAGSRETVLPAEIMQRFVVQPGFLLARINQICVALHNDVSKGETLAQAELLLLLASTDKPDQISMARAAGVDTSTNGLILANLEARHLIVREPDPEDRRRFILRLTTAGRAQVANAREAFLETQARLIEPLTRQNVEDLSGMLRQIGANPMSPAPVWIPEDRHAGVGENIVTKAPSFLCRRALQVCEAYFLTCTASLNLTPRQFSVLFIVNRHAQITQTGFAKIFGLDPATCAVIMKNLASRGLLNRNVSNEDRRARLHSLTPAGKQMLAAAQPLVDKSERLVLRALSRADTRRLVAYLQRIVKAHSHRLGFPGACFDD